MSGNLNFSIILRAVDMASGPLLKLTNQLQNLERTAAAAKNLRTIGDNLQGFAVKAGAMGAAMGASMLPAITAFKDQEAALTAMKIAFMEEGGTVSPFFDAVSAKVVEISNRLPGTTSDFAHMAQALREQGVSADKIAGGILSATANMKALMPALAPAQAAEYMAIFQESLGVAEQDFEKFVDVVQRGKFAFGIDPGSMAYTLKYIGPLISNLGMGGLEGSKSFYALSGVLSQAGVSGEKLGTTLRETLSHLPDLEHKLKKNAELKKILSAADIDLQFFDQGKFIGMENLVVQMEKLRVLNDQDQLRVLKKLFGEEAMTSLAVLVKKGVGGYNEAVDKLAAQATLEQRTTEILTTLQARWETATGNIENMMAVLGRVFEVELKGAVDWIAATAATTGEWIEANAALVKPLGLVTAATSGLMVSLGAGSLVLGTLAKGIGMVLVPMQALAVGAFRGAVALGRFAVASAAAVGRGILGLPRALLSATIALGRFQVAAMMATGSALQTLPATLTRLATAPFRVIAGGFYSMAAGIRAASIAMLTNPVVLGATAIAAAGVLVYKYWEPIKGFFVGLWNGFVSAMQPIQPALDALATAAAPALGPLSKALGLACDAAKGLFGWFSRLLEPVEDVGGAAERLGERWGRMAAGLVTTIVQLGPKLVNAGIGLVDELWRGIASKIDWLISNFTAMVPQGLRNLLNGSPAKEGPLRTVAEGGMGLVSELWRGVSSEAPGFISRFCAAIPNQLTQQLSTAATAGLAALIPLTNATDALAFSGVAPMTHASDALAWGGGMASPALVAAAGRSQPADGPSGGGVTVNVTQNFNVAGGDAAGVASQVRGSANDIADLVRRVMREEDARRGRVGY